MAPKNPINPPQESVDRWWKEALCDIEWTKKFAEKAAQWGADRELEACCAQIVDDPCCGTKFQRRILVKKLREKRRPESPNLKEQALDQLRCIQIDLTRCGMGISVETIRRALESLPT